MAEKEGALLSYPLAAVCTNNHHVSFLSNQTHFLISTLTQSVSKEPIYSYMVGKKKSLQTDLQTVHTDFAFSHWSARSLCASCGAWISVQDIQTIILINMGMGCGCVK